jgi:hypothetical protein
MAPKRADGMSDPIVAVVHDQTTTGARATAIGASSWVFIAESGATTRLVLSARNRHACSALTR